jgi:putative transposase
MLADQALTDQIRQIHARSRGTYGAPRVHAELRLGLDVHVGRKRVARLMGAAGLQGCHRRRLRGLTRRDPDAVPAPDLVERNLTPPGPDRLWVADITQQRTDQGWLYLAVVLDGFSRRIVGWSMADHLRTELVLDALDMAIAQRQPAAGPIHHTDHGCQYTSLAFGRRLQRAGLVASMAPSATHWTTPPPRASSPPWNANCSTATSGRLAKPCGPRCSTFIEVFYNRQRRHSTLDYLTPVDYELQRPSPAPAA